MCFIYLVVMVLKTSLFLLCNINEISQISGHDSHRILLKFESLVHSLQDDYIIIMLTLLLHQTLLVFGNHDSFEGFHQML